MSAAVLPETWQMFLRDAGMTDSLWQEPLTASIKRRQHQTVYPPQELVFNAFLLTPPDEVKVVLLGQDPYHGAGQAEGLAFSVPENVPPPPSLQNIFKEYARDLGRPCPPSGTLRAWAAGGVLLLNSLLTVDESSPGSHRSFGWEKFTDAVIAAISAKRDGVVFLLWGAYAIKKSRFIDAGCHTIISGVHPSPLSAYRGFAGSAPFSRTEAALSGWHWPSLQ